MELKSIYDDVHNTARKIDYETDLRGFSRQTKESYIFHIRKFLEFVKKPARTVNLSDVKNYIIYLKKDKKSPATINLSIAAIKFLYIGIWARKSFYCLKCLKSEKHVPTIISREDIDAMIRAVNNTKHKLLIELLYSSGMRIGEAVKIRIKDLRIEERIALVRKGKGAKDRYVILSEKFIERYGQYMEERKMKNIESEYLFENNISHITIRTGEAIIKNAAAKAGVDYRVFPHAFRASFATHLFENGEQEFNIQRLLGHEDIRTTRVYTRSSLNQLKKIKSPMDY